MKFFSSSILPIAALLLAMTLLAAACLVGLPPESQLTPSAASQPPPTPEPLVPTPLPTFQPSSTPRAPNVTPTASVITPAVASPQPAQPAPEAARARIGVGVGFGTITDFDWGAALPGWYLNWHVDPNPPPVTSTRFAQMVRLNGDSFRPDLAVIRQAAQANPGALWLIGNEPDVAWQDNATPEQYAASYHTLYRALKAADAAAQVAIGGVSQPTPLRMAYLDRILESYKSQFGAEMPVDVWNVHAFILREQSDSWGVGIPPGMPVDQGTLYEIGDHADMAIFRRQISEFRRWMAERGLRDKPLIVTEYGVLMPASYGFPPDGVTNFLVDTFDFFLTARDPEIGCPVDDNRLVQAFNWFSAGDKIYPTSNLFDPDTRAVTPVGEAFRAYVGALP